MKESIKKVVLTVLCFVMMLYAAALSTNAASENHCEYFDELLSRKRGLCLDIYNRDDSWGIANFTFFYMPRTNRTLARWRLTLKNTKPLHVDSFRR